MSPADATRSPHAAWVDTNATHARLQIGGAIADVWQAFPEDSETAWIWAVKDGDCYVRLHESKASAQLAAEDAMISDGIDISTADDPGDEDRS